MSIREITAVDVSNYFTNEAIEKNSPLTMMQALKLTYIAQGFHLALGYGPFFGERILAWKYGPVIAELYEHLKRISRHPPIIGEEQDIDTSLFSDKQKDILSAVFKKYTNFTGWGLSHLTHADGSPWKECYVQGEQREIDESIIEDYFKKIVNPETLAIILSEK